MAITYIGNDIVDIAGGNAITLSIPAAAQADDLILVFVKQSENTTGRVWDNDGGGGRGYVRAEYRRTTGGRDMETAIYWKIHSGSETNPTFTWQQGVTAEPISGTMLIYRGVDTLFPIQDIGFLEGQNNAAPPQPGVSISAYPAKVVAFHGATHDDISAVAPPAGYTLRSQVWNGTSNDHRNLFAADITLASGDVNYNGPNWGHSVLNTTPEYHTYAVVLQEPQAIGLTEEPPLSSNFNQTITLNGYGFGATQGGGFVELWGDLPGTIKSTCAITSWSETQIQFVMTRGGNDDDKLLYLRIQNSNGDALGLRPISVGLTPYQTLITEYGPNHLWPLNGDYTENLNGNAMTVSPINGGGAFEPVVISEDTSQSWRCVNNQRREAPNSAFMNSTSTTNRLMGGWIRLETISPVLQCIYEEGGGVNNPRNLQMEWAYHFL